METRDVVLIVCKKNDSKIGDSMIFVEPYMVWATGPGNGNGLRIVAAMKAAAASGQYKYLDWRVMREIGDGKEVGIFAFRAEVEISPCGTIDCNHLFPMADISSVKVLAPACVLPSTIDLYVERFKYESEYRKIRDKAFWAGSPFE